MSSMRLALKLSMQECKQSNSSAPSIKEELLPELPPTRKRKMSVDGKEQRKKSKDKNQCETKSMNSNEESSLSENRMENEENTIGDKSSITSSPLNIPDIHEQAVMETMDDLLQETEENASGVETTLKEGNQIPDMHIAPIEPLIPVEKNGPSVDVDSSITTSLSALESTKANTIAYEPTESIDQINVVVKENEDSAVNENDDIVDPSITAEEKSAKKRKRRTPSILKALEIYPSANTETTASAEGHSGDEENTTEKTARGHRTAAIVAKSKFNSRTNTGRGGGGNTEGEATTDGQAPTQQQTTARGGKRGGSHRAQQHAHAAAVTAVAATKAEVEWVQCDKCKKWRKVGRNIAVSDLPDDWYCWQNTWDAERNTCEATEESFDDPPAAPAVLPIVESTMTPHAKSRVDTGESNPADMEEVTNTRTKEKRSTRRGATSAEDDEFANPGTASAKKSRRGQYPRHTNANANNTNANPHATPVVDVGAGATVNPAVVAAAGGGGDGNSGSKVNWVQCNKCRKWRKVPEIISVESLPEKWYCTLNSWNPAVAKCGARQEDENDPFPVMATNITAGGVAGAAAPTTNSFASYRYRRQNALLGLNTTDPPTTAAYSTSSSAAYETPGIPQYYATTTAAAAAAATTTTGPGGIAVKKISWVQCERRNCKKWRKVPAHIDVDSFPEKWFCEMNTWNVDAASCEIPEDSDSDTEEKQRQSQIRAEIFQANVKNMPALSYRRIIFGNDGKIRVCFSDKNKAGTGIFSYIYPMNTSHTLPHYFVGNKVGFYLNHVATDAKSGGNTASTSTSSKRATANDDEDDEGNMMNGQNEKIPLKYVSYWWSQAYDETAGMIPQQPPTMVVASPGLKKVPSLGSTTEEGDSSAVTNDGENDHTDSAATATKTNTKTKKNEYKEYIQPNTPTYLLDTIRRVYGMQPQLSPHTTIPSDTLSRTPMKPMTSTITATATVHPHHTHPKLQYKLTSALTSLTQLQRFQIEITLLRTAFLAISGMNQSPYLLVHEIYDWLMSTTTQFPSSHTVFEAVRQFYTLEILKERLAWLEKQSEVHIGYTSNQELVVTLLIPLHVLYEDIVSYSTKHLNPLIPLTSQPSKDEKSKEATTAVATKEYLTSVYAPYTSQHHAKLGIKVPLKLRKFYHATFAEAQEVRPRTPKSTTTAGNGRGSTGKNSKKGSAATAAANTNNTNLKVSSSSPSKLKENSGKKVRMKEEEEEDEDDEEEEDEEEELVVVKEEVTITEAGETRSSPVPLEDPATLMNIQDGEDEEPELQDEDDDENDDFEEAERPQQQQQQQQQSNDINEEEDNSDMDEGNNNYLQDEIQDSEEDMGNTDTVTDHNILKNNQEEEEEGDEERLEEEGEGEEFDVGEDGEEEENAGEEFDEQMDYTNEEENKEVVDENEEGELEKVNEENDEELYEDGEGNEGEQKDEEEEVVAEGCDITYPEVDITGDQEQEEEVDFPAEAEEGEEGEEIGIFQVSNVVVVNEGEEFVGESAEEVIEQGGEEEELEEAIREGVDNEQVNEQENARNEASTDGNGEEEEQMRVTE